MPPSWPWSPPVDEDDPGEDGFDPSGASEELVDLGWHLALAALAEHASALEKLRGRSIALATVLIAAVSFSVAVIEPEPGSEFRWMFAVALGVATVSFAGVVFVACPTRFYGAQKADVLLADERWQAAQNPRAVLAYDLGRQARQNERRLARKNFGFMLQLVCAMATVVCVMLFVLLSGGSAEVQDDHESPTELERSEDREPIIGSLGPGDDEEPDRESASDPPPSTGAGTNRMSEGD